MMMSNALTDPELRALAGMRLADAIDRRLACFRNEQVSAYGPQIKNPEVLRRRLDDLVWTGLRSGYCYEWEGEIPPKLPLTEELVFWDQPKILLQSYLAIAHALHDGTLLATGILEPEAANGWSRVAIPRGLFEIGRYAVFRNGSRIVALSRDGEPEQAYNAVMLSVPEPESTKTPSTTVAPTDTNGPTPSVENPCVCEDASSDHHPTRCSMAEARRWYAERVAWFLADPTRGQPDRIQDVEEGRKLGIPRPVIRALRIELAPQEWQKPGRRPKSGTP